MAKHAHSVPPGVRTRAFIPTIHWQDVFPALIFPALVLIALAGFAQPEVLRHGGAKPHPTVIALAEVAR